MKLVSVAFHNARKAYSYYTDLDVKEGDIAVVETDKGYSFVKIYKTEGVEPIEGVQYRYLVDTVDIASHEKREKFYTG